MTARLQTAWKHLGAALGWVVLIGIGYQQGCVETVDTIYRISSGPRTGECVYSTKYFFGFVYSGAHSLRDEICWEYEIYEAGDEYRVPGIISRSEWEAAINPPF